MTEDNVYAYPNPVTPDYTGLITITGLTLDADVKILNSNGKLIKQGRSNGGTFTWDGFDSEGNRMGRGRGFYDRLLKSTPAAVKIGLAYDFQMLDHIPTKPHDVRMDRVLTDEP